MSTYYVIEINYNGPSQEQHVDADKIEISAACAVTNSRREKCTSGWCGTTNDWSVYAHGEYVTLEQAQVAIAEKFGKVRDADPDGDAFESDIPNVVKTYKAGLYSKMSRHATQK